MIILAIAIIVTDVLHHNHIGVVGDTIYTGGRGGVAWVVVEVVGHLGTNLGVVLWHRIVRFRGYRITTSLGKTGFVPVSRVGRR